MTADRDTLADQVQDVADLIESWHNEPGPRATTDLARRIINAGYTPGDFAPYRTWEPTDLAVHDRAVAQQALRDAAKQARVMPHNSPDAALNEAEAWARWLDYRADALGEDT